MATVYIGTYTQREDHVDGKGAGIYCCRYDATTGALTVRSVEPGIVNPSYLAIDAAQRRLYAVSEVLASAGGPTGAIHAYAIDPVTGQLTFLNRQYTGGGAPCYVSIAEAHVLVANYAGGSVAVFPMQADGSLGAATDVVQHEGSSMNAARQEAPHPHCIILDPASRYAHVPDLGIDCIVSYAFDAERGRLQAGPGCVRTRPGAGPRHLVFNPDGTHAYLISELDATVTVFTYAASTGELTPVATLDAQLEGYDGVRSGADIHLTPDGRFLYASLRGTGSIVGYAVDAETGSLTNRHYASTHGKTPRNFAIDPTGQFLVAANQDSDTLVTFRIDRNTGALSDPVHIADVPSPVCVAFPE